MNIIYKKILYKLAGQITYQKKVSINKYLIFNDWLQRHVSINQSIIQSVCLKANSLCLAKSKLLLYSVVRDLITKVIYVVFARPNQTEFPILFS